MIWQNIQLALVSLRQNKLRSFLTILGIIIGVSSVVTVIAVGNGLKQAITDQVQSFGTNLLQISPGQQFGSDQNGNKGGGFSSLASLGASTLTEHDVVIVQQTPHVSVAAPNMLLSGIPNVDGRQDSAALILATTPDLIKIVASTQKLASGTFLETSRPNGVVLGNKVAETLFPGIDPLGKTLTLRSRSFSVIGVMAKPATKTISFGPDLGDILYMPLETARAINHGTVNIIEIDLLVDSTANVETTKTALQAELKTAHGGETDFSVSTTEDQLKVFNQILNIVTGFIAGIASISLLVGGIGVMNIMLVSVTERTREIGIRKAIGANNRQILTQFLTEAIALSLTGGLLGIGLSFLMSLGIKAAAHISPVYSGFAFALAVGVSSLVGIVFGITPAIKAARKHPVQALRHE